MLTERDAHHRVCPLVTVSCPHSALGCRQQIPRKDVEIHGSHCDHRPEMQPTLCPFQGCVIQVRQCDIESHQQECKFRPEIQVIPCTFPGCSAQVRRSDLPQHFTDCVSDHLSIAVTVLVKLTDSVQSLVESNQIVLNKRCQEIKEEESLATRLTARRTAIHTEIARRQEQDASDMQEHKRRCAPKPLMAHDIKSVYMGNHNIDVCRNCSNKEKYLIEHSDCLSHPGETVFIASRITEKEELRKIRLTERKEIDLQLSLIYHPRIKGGMCKRCQKQRDCPGCALLRLASYCEAPTPINWNKWYVDTYSLSEA